MDGNQKTVALNFLIFMSSSIILTIIIVISSMHYYGKRAIENHTQAMLKLKLKSEELELKKLQTEERVLDKKLEAGKKADE
jgi:hypothetical protein